MVRRVSSQIARNASFTLRSMVRSLLRNRFFASCCDDRRTALAHAAGLRVGDERARGAGDVDAEMVVEAAVFGGERRLDQIVRKIFQRDRVVVLDAAAADRIAVAVEERHREIGLLQPVVIGGFAKRGDRERQHQDQPAEADRGGLRKRFDEDPALPAADIEAVHEGGVALVQFAQALARREQRRVRCAHPDPGRSSGSSASTAEVRSGALVPVFRRSFETLAHPAGRYRDVML